jgi:hypothetical protein
MLFPAKRNHYEPTAPVEIEYYLVARPQQQQVTKQDESPKKKSRNSYFELEQRQTTSTSGPLLPLSVLMTQDRPGEPKYLAALHPHPYDWKIKFDAPSHSYVVDYGPDDRYPSDWNLSASSWAKNQFPEFKEDEVIENMLEKKSSVAYKTKYKNMSAQQIKDLWKETRDQASEQGTFYHLLFENHCNGTLDLAHSKYSHLKPIQQYLKWRREFFDPQFKEFRTEMRFYSGPDTRIVGTADLLVVRKNHPPPDKTGGILTLSIFDWKNTKELKTASFEKGFGPCRNLSNCNADHYNVQQNIYKWLLVNFYQQWKYNGYVYSSVKIECMKLIVVHDFNPSGEAMMIDVPDLPDVINEMVQERKDYLAAKMLEFDSSQ